MTTVTETEQVLLVSPSVTPVQAARYLAKYRAPIDRFNVNVLYQVCSTLEVAPELLIAMWKQESFDVPLGSKTGLQEIGGSALQRITHNPIAIKEPQASTRDRYYYKGTWWRQFGNWDLGLMDAAVYLRQFHGQHSRLSIHDIIVVHCPDIPENKGLPTQVYIKNVCTRITEMRSL